MNIATVKTFFIDKLDCNGYDIVIQEKKVSTISFAGTQGLKRVEKNRFWNRNL